MEGANKKSVLFVCLGNICRSPMGEIIFRALVFDKLDEWRIDSCGTSNYHIGDHPDDRSLNTCRKLIASNISQEAFQHFKSYPIHRARQLCADDFLEFDYIFCMDDSNLSNIKRAASKVKNIKSVIKKIGDYHPDASKRIVEDPYYGNMDGFEENFHQILVSSRVFLQSLESK
eukprot:gene4963-6184_t